MSTRAASGSYVPAPAHTPEDSALLAAIVESSDDAIIGKTLDGIVTSWNRSAERIFGYGSDEMVGQHISRIIPPGREDEEPRILQRLRAGERVDHFDTVRIAKSGRLVDVSLTISPIRDPSGRIIGASKIARDISDRNRAAAANAAFELRLQLAADAAKIGFWEWDLATNKITRSARHAELMGIPVGVDDFDFNAGNLHPDDREAVQHALASGEEYINEFRVIWPDGSVHWLEGRGRAILDENRKATRMSGIIIDISERKFAEQKDHERDAELAHLSRVGTMGNIAAGLAHELGQPLGAIMNYAGVCMNLARTTPLPAESFVAALDEVMNETRRAGAIISRLRDFVRKQSPKSAPVDLNELVRKSISLLNFELQHASTTIELQLAATLPSVLADDIQIEQVLINLICNAMQAMEEMPTPERKLVIQTDALSDGFVQVSVIDAGKGIAPQLLDRLFEPFFTTKPQGLGVGLNISRSIVASHGGRMLATPNATRGMRFTFALPRESLSQPLGERS